ncbi:DUF2163 domain-containing protein [Salmonella enterica]|nr:DUF2163 domain-containing protein [Salmonella enterica]EGI5258359.1 DUF2163 domain-containing protein [Salmonella enterica subsp. enterica serovar Weltevreden]
MSWSESENSVSAGQPVRLYEFIYGDEKHYRYTSADRQITAEREIWEPIAISDSGVATGTDNNEMTVTLPADTALAQLYTGIPPSSPVKVRIHMLHYGDASTQVITVWAGTVTNRKRSNAATAELSCVSLAATFSRSGVRLTWGRACPYSLYDSNCRVSVASHKLTLTITATSGSGITVNMPSSTPDGWFSGGYIEYTTAGVTQRRGARAHKGNVIDLFGGAAGLTTGQEITVLPGCDLTIATCNEKFSNCLNYGGIPHLPDINPWQIIKVF